MSQSSIAWIHDVAVMIEELSLLVGNAEVLVCKMTLLTETVMFFVKKIKATVSGLKHK